jgi:CheY-like chemotaxis protein
MAINPVNRKLIISKVKPTSKYNSVLLIDDQELDNWITQKILEAANFSENIYVHTSSESALEFLQNLAKNPHIPTNLLPDFIFMNIKMSNMNGFQFVENFQKLPPTMTNHIKFVLMSAAPTPKEEAAVNALGCVYKYLPKPISIDLLGRFSS